MARAIQADTANQFWWMLLLRISQAGAWYPMVTICVWGLIVAISSLSPLSVIAAMLGLLLFSLILFCFGFLYAAIVGGFALPATWIALKALRRQSRPDRIGMFAGGLVAFLCTLPVQIGIFEEGQLNASSLVGVLIGWLMIPSVAIFFGQVGGALAAPHTLRARRLDPAQKKFELGAPRFSIAQLLGLMVVFSVTLSLLKLSGLLTTPVMIAAGVWAAFQSVSASPAAWVANRLLGYFRRKRLRQSRMNELGRRVAEHNRRLAELVGGHSASAKKAVGPWRAD